MLFKKENDENNNQYEIELTDEQIKIGIKELCFLWFYNLSFVICLFLGFCLLTPVFEYINENISELFTFVFFIFFIIMTKISWKHYVELMRDYMSNELRVQLIEYVKKHNLKKDNIADDIIKELSDDNNFKKRDTYNEEPPKD